MEALAAIGLASNIVQFADCGIRWASSAIELYTSGNGVLQENSELEKVINSLRSVVLGLKTEKRLHDDKNLDALVAACLPLADELTVILSKLKVDWQNKSRTESIRKALQSLRKKEHIRDIGRRLERIRDQIYVHVNFLLVSRQFVLVPSLRELADIQKSMAVDTQNSLGHISAVRSSLEDMSLRLQSMAAPPTRDIAGWPQGSSKEFPSLLQTFCEKTRDFNKLRRILKGLMVFVEDSDVNLRSWMRSGSGLYWISGKAGSGKSTLMKFLEEHKTTHHLLKEWAGSHGVVTASHYFWSAGTPMQKSQGGLFRTLLSQILINCPEVAPLICGERWEENSFDSLKGWTHRELCNAFRRLSSLQQLPVRFCFLIDGLDEYDGDHHELAELLIGISRSSNIKICASSRPWNNFIDLFGQSQWKLFIHELTKNDVRLYTKDNLKQNRRFLQLQDREPVAAESLTREISERSQGVFLWVYLVIRSLLRGLANRDEIRDLQRRLDELPNDLEEYFELMMSRIENVYRTRTARIFRTLIEAEGQLPLIALRFLDMEQDDPDYATGKKIVPLSKDQLETILEDLKWQLNAQCKDLVEMRQAPEVITFKDETIGFLHRTVIDFLRMKRINDLLRAQSGPRFDPVLAFLKITLAHFKIRPVDDPFTKQSTPFLVLDILHLARELERRCKCSETLLLDDFWETNSTAKGFLRLDWAFTTPVPCCFMCVAANFGLSLYVTQNFERFSGGEEHQARILRLTLDSRTMMFSDLLGVDTFMSLSTIEFLLKKGISPNSLFSKTSTIWSDYIMMATSQYREDKLDDVFEVCRLMISYGADRWMRSKAAIEASGYCDPVNDVMPHLQQLFSLEQFGILSSLYNESSARAVQETELTNKRHENFQGWAGCQYPLKNRASEMSGSFNHQVRGRGRGRGRGRRHHTGRGGANGGYAPPSGAFSFHPNTPNPYAPPTYPQWQQPFGSHARYQANQTQANGHFATQGYPRPPSSQWPRSFSPTPSHAYLQPRVPANTQIAAQSYHHPSQFPSMVPPFHHNGASYPSREIAHIMGSGQSPNYPFQWPS